MSGFSNCLKVVENTATFDQIWMKSKCSHLSLPQMFSSLTSPQESISMHFEYIYPIKTWILDSLWLRNPDQLVCNLPSPLSIHSLASRVISWPGTLLGDTDTKMNVQRFLFSSSLQPALFSHLPQCTFLCALTLFPQKWA